MFCLELLREVFYVLSTGLVCEPEYFRLMNNVSFIER